MAELGITVVVTALVLGVVYTTIAYPVLRKRFREGRPVQYKSPDGRVRKGTIAQTPRFGFGLSAKNPVSITTKKGELIEIPYKRVTPM